MNSQMEPELIIDDNRKDEPTGIYVRAKTKDGKWQSVDIARLTHASITRWLRMKPNLAENTVLHLLGYM